MKYELGIIENTSITQTIQSSGSIHILKHISSLLPQQPFRKFCFLATPHLSIKRSASVCIPRRRVPTLPATTKKLPKLPGSHTNAWDIMGVAVVDCGEIYTSETKNRTLCKLGLRINLPKKSPWHLRCNAVLKKCSLSSWRKKLQFHQTFHGRWFPSDCDFSNHSYDGSLENGMSPPGCFLYLWSFCTEPWSWKMGGRVMQDWRTNIWICDDHWNNDDVNHSIWNDIVLHMQPTCSKNIHVYKHHYNHISYLHVRIPYSISG